MPQERACRGNLIQVNLGQGLMEESVSLKARLYITRRDRLLKSDLQMLRFSLLVNISRQRNLLRNKVFLLASILVAKSVLVNAAIGVLQCRAASAELQLSTLEGGGEMTIFERVKKIIVEQLGVPEEKVVPEARFREDLGADSLDLVELIMAFEDEFGGRISDDDARKIQTVGDAVAFLEQHGAQ